MVIIEWYVQSGDRGRNRDTSEQKGREQYVFLSRNARNTSNTLPTFASLIVPSETVFAWHFIHRIRLTATSQKFSGK